MYAIYKCCSLFFTISILSILHFISNYICFSISFLRLFPYRLIDSFFFSFSSSFHSFSSSSSSSSLFLQLIPSILQYHRNSTELSVAAGHISDCKTHQLCSAINHNHTWQQTIFLLSLENNSIVRSYTVQWLKSYLAMSTDSQNVPHFPFAQRQLFLLPLSAMFSSAVDRQA